MKTTDKTYRTGTDKYEYFLAERPIVDGDWVYNTLKDVVYKTGDAARDNKSNDDIGVVFLPVEATNNPHLVNDGVTLRMSDIVWFMSLSIEERTRIIQKYAKEVKLGDFDPLNSPFSKDVVKYYRDREDNVITNDMAERMLQIREEGTKRCRWHGFTAGFDTERYKGFIEGAEWADANPFNGYLTTEQAVKKLWQMQSTIHAVEAFAKAKYQEKFPRTNNPNAGWSEYYFYKITSENTMEIYYRHGGGDMDFQDSFEVKF